MNPISAFISITVVLDIIWLLSLIGLPLWMNSTLLGVYIPQEDRQLPQISSIRRRFLELGLAGAVIGILLAFIAYSLSNGSEGWTLALLLVPQAIGVSIAWNLTRRQALALKKERGWKLTDSSKRTAYIGEGRRHSVSGIRPWAYLLHLIVIAVSWLIVARNWNHIPNPLPVHFDAAGLPDRYQVKSLGSVYMLNFVQLGMTLLFFLIHLSLAHMPRRLDPKDPEGSLRKQKLILTSNTYVLYFVSLIVTLMFSFMQARSTYAFDGTLPLRYFFTFLGVLLVPIVLLLIYVKRKGLTEENMHQRFGDDQHWRGGLFYYNPQDPSFMTEKRFGLGWTFNFARPVSWFIMTAIVLVPVAAVSAAILLAG
ncbi:hypothetical protein B9G55_03080 [Saccharibacillus sp. O16]|nr:hypothetical protein B9G55_03080 [Saccharibacillus sp. O16]